ncbi:MAG: hypothetical protein WC759_01910 [Candidatus Micrarchaeia archaeon]|jgi:hypothetical protein
MRFPLSRSTILWYIVPIFAFFAAALLFFGTSFDYKQVHTERFGIAPAPNTPLQLKPGERYAYAYNISGIMLASSYQVVGLSGNCMLVRGIISSANGSASASACVYPSNGTAVNENNTLDFFQDWMLSLSENWSWSAGMRIVYPKPIDLQDVTITKYAVLAKEKKFGRDAFKISASTQRTVQNATTESSGHLLWVDSEKRVLLAIESKDGALSGRIASAPFDLVQD